MSTIWNQRFNDLQEFLAEHLRSPQGSSANPAERRLFRWMHIEQRKAQNGELTADKVDRLAQVNAGVTTPGEKADRAWNFKMGNVCAFVSAHGRLPTVTSTIGMGERRLGGWLERQRQAERRGQLTLNQSDRLRRALAKADLPQNTGPP